MNGISLSVRNSYISDIKSADQDTQAISGWNGPGPFQIVNNYLEAAGENILFGGATGPIAGVVPSDIEIRGNYMFKPLSWKKGDPSFGGTAWQVKNLLELKSARRILITGNILENNWPHAQNGFAVLFTVRTQDDTCPWCIIEDVTFENNLLRNIYAGVNILGQDGVGRAHRMIVRNNFWQTESTLFQVLTEAEDVTFEHNTAVNGHSVIVLDGKPSPRLVFVNNLVMNAKYGIIGGGAAPGLGSIQRYLPAARIQKNVIIGANASDYPAGNFFPALPAHVLFQNSSSDDYRL